jgi:hypothetical protein
MLSMPRIVRPGPLRIAKRRFGSPVGSTTRRSIKRNKELGYTFDPFTSPSNGQKKVPNGLPRGSTEDEPVLSAQVYKHKYPRDKQLIAPEVGFGAVFPCISLHWSSLHLSNQANSSNTRASFFTAFCWQFCWHFKGRSNVDRGFEPCRLRSLFDMSLEEGR